MKRSLIIKVIFLNLALGLLFFQNVLAQSLCPEDRGIASGEGHPDIDMNVRGWVDMDGQKNLFNIDHDTDQGRAPQLSTLIENKNRLDVNSLYRINNWDWDKMQVAEPLHEGEDFATMVGFSTSAGEKVLVPSSKYDISGGYEVMVLYATSNSITIKYTAEDDVVDGYAIHLIGFDVDPEIVDFYNIYKDEMGANGRASLPMLWAGWKLGTARDGEIKVVIRDKGSFMDPRWLDDWWISGSATEDTNPDHEPKTIDPLPTKCLSVNLYDQAMEAKCGDIPMLPGETDTVYRPAPCSKCGVNEKVPGDTKSCSEPFTFLETTTVSCGELSLYPNSCDGQTYQVRRSWKGDVKIDTSMAKVPFVGYHTTFYNENGDSINPNLYLNDYFTGTYLYDGQSKSIEDANLLSELGVFRKLAPTFLQDKLKVELIESDYDYVVENGSKELTMQDFRGKYPPKLEDFLDDIKEDSYSSRKEYDKLVEEKTEEWRYEREKWEDSSQGELWANIPMFSREDAPGKLEMLIEKEPAEISKENNRTSGYEELVKDGLGQTRHVYFGMSVPHLARLHDISEAMYQMLMPTMENEEVTEEDMVSYLPKTQSDYVMAAPSFSQILSEDNIESQVLGVSTKADRPECKNGEDSGPGCVDTNAITNTDPKDPICCSGTLGVDFDDYIVELTQEEKDKACSLTNSCSACMDVSTGEAFGVTDPAECISPNYCIGSSSYEETMERAVSVQFHVPYLKEIYEKTIGPGGFYNIFKINVLNPDENKTSNFNWPDVDAKSNIFYEPVDSSIDYESRELYFPYLGGLNITKKCISENLLAPTDFAGPKSNCDFKYAQRGFDPYGGEGDRPAPSYIGRCDEIANIEDLKNEMLASGCFDNFCQFIIEEDRTNQYVPAGWSYDNTVATGANQGMWVGESVQQNTDEGYVFEQWPETEGKVNDNTSDGACDFMLNMHRAYALYNSCFSTNIDGKKVSVCYSNVNRFAASTANNDGVKRVGNCITSTAHAYIYDEASGGHVTDDSQQILTMVCVDGVCEKQWLSNRAESPTTTQVCW